MSAVRAALLPHPPLLLPELAGGAASELDPLRAACRKAVDDVLGASGALVVIGDGPVWGIAARAAVGSFQPYGAAVEVRLPEERLWADLPGLPEPHRLDELPLSLAIAAWLLAPPSGAAASPGGDRHPQSAEADDAALAEVDVRPGEEERVQSAAAPAARPDGAAIRPSKGLRAAGAGEPPAAGPAAAAPGGADVSPGKGRGLHVVRTGEPPAVTPGAATPASADASEGEGGAQAAGVAEMPALARARWVGSPAGGPGDEGGEAGNGDFPPLVACTIPATLGPGAAAAVGRTLVEMAAAHGPVGVIAMADLSARRTAAAPGAYHPAAATFDAGIADALAGGDLDALATIDPVEAAELLVGGRAVLQALAEAMRGGTPPSGHVLYDEAPYGVGYLVAVLTSLVEAAPPAGTRAR
jgi:hypothetical protein